MEGKLSPGGFDAVDTEFFPRTAALRRPMLLTVSVNVPASLNEMRGSQLVRGLLLVALALLLITDLTTIFSRIYLSTAPHAAAQQTQDQVSITKKQKLSELANALKNSCLPKLICELNASTEKDKFSAKAKYLLQLLRDTSIGHTAEGSSRYHFAAHMGQLISGIDGTGCHNFYPNCPLPGAKVLSLLNKPSLL